MFKKNTLVLHYEFDHSNDLGMITDDKIQILVLQTFMRVY
jgi:hypothetical protein